MNSYCAQLTDFARYQLIRSVFEYHEVDICDCTICLNETLDDIAVAYKNYCYILPVDITDDTIGSYRIDDITSSISALVWCNILQDSILLIGTTNGELYVYDSSLNQLAVHQLQYNSILMIQPVYYSKLGYTVQSIFILQSNKHIVQFDTYNILHRNCNNSLKYTMIDSDSVSGIMFCSGILPFDIDVLMRDNYNKSPSIIACGTEPILSFYTLSDNTDSNDDVVDVAKQLSSVVFSYATYYTRGLLGSNNVSHHKQSESTVIEPISIEWMRCIRDKQRSIINCYSDSTCSYGVCVDNLERVLLIDLNNFVVTRLFKGYRNAVCAFARTRNNQLSLIIHANQRIDCYLVSGGERIFSMSVSNDSIIVTNTSTVSLSLISKQLNTSVYLLKSNGQLQQITIQRSNKNQSTQQFVSNDSHHQLLMNIYDTLPQSDQLNCHSVNCIELEHCDVLNELFSCIDQFIKHSANDASFITNWLLHYMLPHKSQLMCVTIINMIITHSLNQLQSNSTPNHTITNTSIKLLSNTVALLNMYKLADTSIINNISISTYIKCFDLMTMKLSGNISGAHRLLICELFYGTVDEYIDLTTATQANLSENLTALQHCNIDQKQAAELFCTWFDALNQASIDLILQLSNDNNNNIDSWCITQHVLACTNRTLLADSVLQYTQHTNKLSHGVALSQYTLQLLNKSSTPYDHELTTKLSDIIHELKRLQCVIASMNELHNISVQSFTKDYSIDRLVAHHILSNRSLNNSHRTTKQLLQSGDVVTATVFSNNYNNVIQYDTITQSVQQIQDSIIDKLNVAHLLPSITINVDMVIAHCADMLIQRFVDRSTSNQSHERSELLLALSYTSVIDNNDLVYSIAQYIWSNLIQSYIAAIISIYLSENEEITNNSHNDIAAMYTRIASTLARSGHKVFDLSSNQSAQTLFAAATTNISLLQHALYTRSTQHNHPINNKLIQLTGLSKYIPYTQSILSADTTTNVQLFDQCNTLVKILLMLYTAQIGGRVLQTHQCGLQSVFSDSCIDFLISDDFTSSMALSHIDTNKLYLLVLTILDNANPMHTTAVMELSSTMQQLTSDQHQALSQLAVLRLLENGNDSIANQSINSLSAGVMYMCTVSCHIARARLGLALHALDSRNPAHYDRLIALVDSNTWTWLSSQKPPAITFCSNTITRTVLIKQKPADVDIYSASTLLQNCMGQLANVNSDESKQVKQYASKLLNIVQTVLRGLKQATSVR